MTIAFCVSTCVALLLLGATLYCRRWALSEEQEHARAIDDKIVYYDKWQSAERRYHSLVIDIVTIANTHGSPPTIRPDP